MSVETLLSRLERVKPSGTGRWNARCPAHDDNGPSLSIRELDDGRVLVHCFAGCAVHEVVASVGLEITDLFPEQEIQHGKPESRPFPAADALRAVGFETLVVAAAGAALLAGQPFTQVDRERLTVAVGRIQSAISAVMPQMKGRRHG